MSKKCSIYLKSSVLLQNIITIIITIIIIIILLLLLLLLCIVLKSYETNLKTLKKLQSWTIKY